MHFAVPVVFLATRAGAVAAARPALESLGALEQVAKLEARHEKLSQRIQQVVERAGPATSRAQHGHREQQVPAEAVVDAEAALAGGSSLAELEQKAQLVAQLAAGNPLFCLGRLGGYICMALAGCALFAYIGRVCFGEKSCWYTWPFCQKLRLALNMDCAPAFSLQCTVHRARDIAPGNTLFVAVFSRRTAGKKAPKMPSGNVPKTADSIDYKWEQALSVQVEQGAEEVCFCVFSAGAIRSATLIGYDTVSVESLLDKNAEKIDKKWIYLKDGKDTPAGGLQITVLKPQLPGKKGAKGASAAAAAAAMAPLDTAVPNVQGMDTEETLTEYQKALCGPLNVASRNGEYTLRYFNVERKRDVWIWSWYKGGKKPGPSAKPLGRIPLMSISTIYEVPNSISEFIVRYRDATDSGVDMMLQRHDRPRENWVKTLHAMLALIRDLRKQGDSGQAKKGKKAKKDHSLKKSKSKQITESSEAASDSGSVAVDSDSD